MPVLELTTIGRKSGQPRTVMLTSPAAGGPDHRGGGFAGWRRPAPGLVPEPPRAPRGRGGWQGQPAAQDAGPGGRRGRRARLWPRVTADHKNYAGYQTKTDRQIPLVLLEPEV